MYNRYVPQADGSFQRSRVPESSPAQEQAVYSEPIQKTDAPKEMKNTEPIQMNAPPGKLRQSVNRNRNRSITNEQNAGSVGGFLRSLLPQNFDTEDLIVVLLLLLMSGNTSADQNAALMTLGIYLFM